MASKGPTTSPKEYASPINQFFRESLNPWLNLHRPCLFATEVLSPKGKVVKRYRHEDVKTPLEKLVQLNENGLVRLQAGVAMEQLQQQAAKQTDLNATLAMQRAKAALFASFNRPIERRA